MITVDDVVTLCRSLGLNPCYGNHFRICWELLKLCKLDEDILVHYLNELI